MRLKDLRWYILASVILILSYAAIAVCYYLPIRAKAESSMKVLGLEATDNISMIATSKANAIYDSFMKDDLVVDTSFNQTALEGKFDAKGFKDNERKIILARDKDFVFNSVDTSYYLYFFKDQTSRCGRLSLEELFKFVVIDEQINNCSIYIYDKDGTIFYDNTHSDYKLMANILGTSSFNLLENSEEFNGVYKIDGVNGVLSGVAFFSGYISTFIPITSPYFAIDWVLQQGLIFYAIGIVVVIAMLIILILGCKKASKLLRVDRHGLQRTNAIVIRTDLNGKVIFTNKAFKQLYGVRRLEDVSQVIDVDTSKSILYTMKENKPFECYLAITDDEVKYFQLSPLKISSSYYLMGNDITIDYLRRKHLFLMSGRNEITNCDNNFSLINNFNHIIQSASYYDVAFIQYNIHKYEDIIGVYGRTNFNLLLNEFLNSIHEIYEDLSIYHINDAEFIVVFPHLEMEEVTTKIEQSLDMLRRPFQINENHIYIKCKIVVYDLTQAHIKEVPLQTIKEKMELALKNIADFSTKDYIIYEPAMDNVIASTEKMEKDLVRGLQNDEFVMYLQPQYDVVSNRIDGFEALIRWNNIEYKDKSPQAFIELAEQRGYMLDIGRYVVKETFRLAKKLENYNIHISMNVSPIQIMQVGFVQQLIDEFKVLRLKPGSIAIEITETFLMKNFQLIVEKLKQLKEQGFRIHLDDFCTGYSSMLYLKDLPVDTIKVDKDFIRYVQTNKVYQNIVKAMCQFAQALDLDIICEGVENQEQAEQVKKFGARVIQGYLIGKALPYDEALKLLQQYNSKKK